MMSHEMAAELLEAAALDVLPADEQERVVAHAETCLVCGPELTRLRDAVALMAYSVPPRAEDLMRRERIRTRLLERAQSHLPGMRTPTPVRMVTPVGSRRSAQDVAKIRSGRALSVTGWVLACAAAIVLMISHRHDTAELRALTGAHVSVMDLAPASATSSAPDGSAHMFWDHVTNRWTFVAHHMPSLAADRTYQVWLVTTDGKVSAGTFAPSSDGDGVVRATYALAANALQAVAVTEEPTGGSPQPTGALIIAAAAGGHAGA